MSKVTVLHNFYINLHFTQILANYSNNLILQPYTAIKNTIYAEDHGVPLKLANEGNYLINFE